MFKKSPLALTLLTLLSVSAIPVMADDDMSKWTLRGSIARVSPNDDSSTVLGNDGVSVDPATGLGLSLTYWVDKHWGVEILAASPFSHDIVGTGALSGLAIGSTKQLPPTISAVYQWGDATKYHVGGGINHTIFFNSHTSSQLTSALAASSTDLDLSSSTGLALTVGFDTPISDNWSFSGNVYYINIDTQADVIVNGAVAATVNVDINPWVYMLGFSTRF